MAYLRERWKFSGFPSGVGKVIALKLRDWVSYWCGVRSQEEEKYKHLIHCHLNYNYNRLWSQEEEFSPDILP